MPWVIRSRWGNRESSLTVCKGVYTQLIFSDCGPVGRRGTSVRKGVNTSAIRCVLAALASRCGRPRLCCWPCVRLIATDTGFSTGTVELALREAADQGWLQIKPLAKHRAKKRRSGGAWPHEYHLMIPKLDVRAARSVIRGYVGHDWDTRVTAKDRDCQAESDITSSSSDGLSRADLSY